MVTRFALALTLAAAAYAQRLPGAWFELREMDMHLHCGLERETGLDAWIDLAAADGRKVIVALDHLELYREGERKKPLPVFYPFGPAGHRAFWDELDALAARRRDVILFKGWEVYEGELDTGIEAGALAGVDVIGWHISPNHGRRPPDGQALIRRIRQVLDLQKRFPVPMILFHPFPMRLEHIQRKARAAGRPLAEIPVADYRFFQPGEQAEVARLLRGTSVYIEISRDESKYIQDPACRQALIDDIAPLAQAGVEFSISTDNHSVASARQPFHPTEWASLYGVSPANTNGIVRDLLVLRERKRLAAR